MNYYSFARTELVDLIPKSAEKILDIGCGEGVLGKTLKTLNSKREVVGVEKNEYAYKMAVKNLDRAFLGDIEKMELPYKENYFDCIIAADVLEHLVDPWETLKKLKTLLKEKGVFIASIPNIRYYKVLIRLFRGSWDYVDMGILDRTHLRFFCLVNIKEMFQREGFIIERVMRNVVAARGFRILNFLLFNILKDFLTYQYYIVSKRGHLQS